MPDDTTPPTDTKPGIATSEFWLSLVAVILGALAASGLIADGSTAMRVVGLAITVLAALGYTGSRTVVKKAAS